MKRFTRLIPLVAIAMSLGACQQPLVSSSVEESSSIIQSSENQEEKALEEAKERARTLLESAVEDNYIGNELAELKTLKIALVSAIENAKVASDLDEAYNALDQFLKTAKTKAEYEAEAAQALAEAKKAASEYLKSVDPSLYEGTELATISGLIDEINGLLETATTADEINAKVQALKDYIATAKTKAEYEQERAQALQARKEERAKEVEFARPNRFRSEELAAIKAAQKAFIDAVNACETIDDVNAVSKEAFENALHGKTNSEYMLDEMFNHRDLSTWPLVNEHADNFTYDKDHHAIYVDEGVGANAIGYLMSPVKYQGNFEVSLRLKMSDINTSIIGLMFGNYHDKSTGDGIDGYLINYDSAADHQFVQIWYLQNAYASFGDGICQYIGGWVYNDAYPEVGALGLRNIRVKYDGEYIHIMDDQEFIEFGEENTIKISVPLALNNQYSIDPQTKSYSFGFLNWDGAGLDKVRGVYVDELVTESETDSRSAATQVARCEIAKVNLSLYEDVEKNQFEGKIAEIEALYAEGSYTQIMAKVDEFIALRKTLKTHEELEQERHPNIAIQLLDNIYSGDPTRYTPSNWDAVNDNVFTKWTHVTGSNVVITDGSAGYCMDAAVHTNFTAVFKVTGTQVENPYNLAWPKSAIIFGANPNGNYFTGIEIVLNQDNDWGFQFYSSMTGAVGDPGCYGDQFMGGFGLNSEGVTYRVTVMNGVAKVFVVNTTTGAEVQMSGVNAGFQACSEWNVGNISGHFGFMDWEGETTFELLEFKDL